ncbi:hypothetical protein EMCRGX_G000268 [Ephydatia muelleri]
MEYIRILQGKESQTVHINAVGFMQQHFKDLLDNKKYVDVTFVVEGQPVPAHRLILASQSDYFDRLFYGKMREANSSDEIPLPNAPLEALRLLLEFMYSGCLDYDNQPLQERLCAVMCITEVDRNLLHEAILCPANTGLHPRIESLLSMKQGGSPTHADQVIYLGSIPHKSYAHERDSHTHHQPSSCILDLGDHYLVNYIELQGYPTASHPDRCRLCFLYTLKVSRDKLHWHKLFDFSVFKCCGNQHLCFPQQVVSSVHSLTQDLHTAMYQPCARSLRTSALTAGWACSSTPIAINAFQEEAGPTFEVVDTPAETFSRLFPDTLIDHLVEETNHYAEQEMGSDD